MSTASKETPVEAKTKTTTRKTTRRAPTKKTAAKDTSSVSEKVVAPVSEVKSAPAPVEVKADAKPVVSKTTTTRRKASPAKKAVKPRVTTAETAPVQAAPVAAPIAPAVPKPVITTTKKVSTASAEASTTAKSKQGEIPLGDDSAK